MQKLGLRDLPIEHSVDETLGLAPYASVLTEFVERCDTPITIALQGDWGSGKTSLMNLIKESLDDKEGTYQTVWFNTWQYAQFNMSDTLALSMMTYFIDCLSPKGGAAATAAKSLLNVARAVAVGGASVIGHGDTIKTVLTEAQEGTSSTTDPSRALTDLKNQLTKLVQERVEPSNLRKVVVFIDDIDRLVPVKAIELLEALKIFLDIDQCVYIIACDYSVVVTGLKEKFGVSEGELKGKSFFDKIIQVPFKMPINRYDIDKYLARLLKEIDIPTNEDDIEIYRDLIQCSVGFNPRTMKRLFNSLLLLTILAKDQLDLDSDNKKRESYRVLFGVLCMQEHYESLYDYIRRQNISDGMFHELIERVASDDESDDEIEELRKSMSDTDLAKAKEFLHTFFQCVQLQEDGDDQALSEAERRHLKDVLGLSAIVSAGNDFQGLEASTFVVSMRRELNLHYAGHLNRKRKRIGQFRFTKRDGEVWLELPPPLDGFYFFIWCGEDGRLSYGISSYSDDEEGLQRVNEHLKGEMGIEGGSETYHGRYVEWKVEEDGSRLGEFKDCLYEVLDTLLPDLAGICSRAS